MGFFVYRHAYSVDIYKSSHKHFYTRYIDNALHHPTHRYRLHQLHITAEVFCFRLLSIGFYLGHLSRHLSSRSIRLTRVCVNNRSICLFQFVAHMYIQWYGIQSFFSLSYGHDYN